MWGVGCGVSDTVLGEVTGCGDFRSLRLEIGYVSVRPFLQSESH